MTYKNAFDGLIHYVMIELFACSFLVKRYSYIFCIIQGEHNECT